MTPTVTVITISYNAENEIGATIDSVLSQSVRDYEYVFIDGASKDRTMELIRAGAARCEELGIACQVVSEPDKGIYDAMNKGIALARGQWILMLNAGDVLAHHRVFEMVFSGKVYDADVLYGDVVYKDKSKNRYYYKRAVPAPLKNIVTGMVFCHQCTFVRGEVLKAYGFDIGYRITADYDSFVRMYLDGKRFAYIQKVISVYDCTGLSMASLPEALAETNKIKAKAGFLVEDTTARGAIFRIKHLIRRLIQQHLPSVAYAKWRGWDTKLPENME